jgi:hypothetical protein
MAGNKLQSFKADVLERIVRGSTADLTATTMWIHLYNTTLNDADTPASTGRCAGTGYNPANVTNSTDTWTNPSTASPSATENKIEISYTTSAGSGWGTIQAIMITSSSGTGGVGYYWGDVSPTQAISTGNIVKFSTGAIDITEA